MKILFPEVLSEILAEDHVRLTLNVSKDIGYFKGHFPEFPLLPGVVQVDWVFHFAQHHFGESMSLKAINLIKFQRPIQPNTKIVLELSWDAEKRQLRFSYSDDKWTYSQGRVVVL